MFFFGIFVSGFFKRKGLVDGLKIIFENLDKFLVLGGRQFIHPHEHEGMGLEMFPVNHIQNFRVAMGKSLLVQLVKEGVIDLNIEDLFFEVALFRGEGTQSSRENPFYMFLCLSYWDICLQYCQSWRGVSTCLLLRVEQRQGRQVDEGRINFLRACIVFNYYYLKGHIGREERMGSGVGRVKMDIYFWYLQMDQQGCSDQFLIVAQKMNNFANCVLQTLKHVPKIAASSGHFAFQYGNYAECISEPDYRYHMVEFNVFNGTNGITMGLCMPKQCSNSLITTVLSQAFKASGTPIKIYRVVTDPQNYPFPYDWTFFLTLLIIILSILLVLGASLRKKTNSWHKGFSIQNTWQMMNKQRQPELRVLNGIRAITLMWVIMGNTFINALIGAINVITLDDIIQRPFSLMVEATLLSSDVFFFLSGFFMAYSFCKEMDYSVKRYPLAILSRLLRIIPAYLMTILVWYSMFMHWGSGPRWVPNQQYSNLCKNMWRTLLFVDNLVNNGHTLCMSWAFYNQLDFQVFLIGIAILFIYHKSKIASLVVTVGLIAYSWTVNLIYTQQNGQKYPVTFNALYKYQFYIFDVFIKPWMRWTPYFFGLYFGVVYAAFKSVKDKEAEMELGFRKASLGGKVLILKHLVESYKGWRRFWEWFWMAVLAMVVFLPRMLQVGYEWPQFFHSMCLNFGHILFPFAVFMVVLPIVLGIKHSFIKTLLDVPFFNFVSRISYSAYLVHGLVILYIANVKWYDTYYWISDLYVNSLAAILLCLFFGGLLSLLVEYPCLYYSSRWMMSLKGRPKREEMEEEMEEQGVLIGGKGIKESQSTEIGDNINKTVISQR